jgi:hypothetical protein
LWRSHPARHFQVNDADAKKTMSDLQHFEIVGDHAEYRPTGQVTFAQMSELVAGSIEFTRGQGIRNLLVVTSGLSGFESPGVGDRYFLIQKWSLAARSSVRLALVPSPEMIDPQRFGVTAAANVGFDVNVFATDLEALAWLRGK